MAMTFEDYKRETMGNALDALPGYVGYCDDFSQVWDELFVDDAVTGNGSGSYTFSTYQAEQNTQGLFWDDEFLDALKGYGYEGIPTEQGPEALDVIARCLALDYCYAECEEKWDELTAPNYRYEIQDSYGAPQCGVESVKFEEWYELESYLDDNPDVYERVKDGYAVIIPL